MYVCMYEINSNQQLSQVSSEFLLHHMQINLHIIYTYYYTNASKPYNKNAVPWTKLVYHIYIQYMCPCIGEALCTHVSAYIHANIHKHNALVEYADPFPCITPRLFTPLGTRAPPSCYSPKEPRTLP